MIDERPIRCFIHPKLKDELGLWYELLNKKSLSKTGYPIKEGAPMASKICAMILESIRMNTGARDILIENAGDKQDRRLFDCTISVSEDIDKNINLRISKIQGVKKNDIFF